MERANKSAGKLLVWQTIYLASAAAVLPFAAFLYLQGQYTRRKIGVLPDAGGERSGIAGYGADTVKLLVIGESTIAGLGARTHEFALAGQFAQLLAARIGKKVDWTVIGKNGVTARRTIDELVPPPLEMREEWTLAQFIGFLRTWSATQRFLTAHGEERVLGFEAELKQRWGSLTAGRRTVSWPMVIRAGEIR